MACGVMRKEGGGEAGDNTTAVVAPRRAPLCARLRRGWPRVPGEDESTPSRSRGRGATEYGDGLQHGGGCTQENARCAAAEGASDRWRSRAVRQRQTWGMSGVCSLNCRSISRTKRLYADNVRWVPSESRPIMAPTPSKTFGSGPFGMPPAHTQSPGLSIPPGQLLAARFRTAHVRARILSTPGGRARPAHSSVATALATGTCPPDGLCGQRAVPPRRGLARPPVLSTRRSGSTRPQRRAAQPP